MRRVVLMLLPLLACGPADPPFHAPPPPGPLTRTARAPVPDGPPDYVEPEPPRLPHAQKVDADWLGMPLQLLVPTRDLRRGVMLDLPVDASLVACDAQQCAWVGAISQTRFTTDFKELPVINAAAVRAAVGDLGDVREEPSGHWQVKQNCGHFWHFLPVGGRMVRLHCQIDGLSTTGRGSCTADEPRHTQVGKACGSLRQLVP